LVLSKKVTKTGFFKKKETKTDRFRFGYIGKKPVQTDLARFFPVWLGFLLSFFLIFFSLGSVQLQAYEIELVSFFKILISFFFHGSVFQLFFYGFLNLIGFSVFLFIPNRYYTFKHTPRAACRMMFGFILKTN
jgi:hypothetical protein